MIRPSKFKPAAALLAAGLILRAPAALACAACFGKSDSPLADAMNWGIFSLLGVVVCVLGGVAAFAIFLVKKSAAASAAPVAAAAVAAPAPAHELLNSAQKA